MTVIDINEFTDAFHDSDHVRYRWGSKPDLGIGWGAVKDADCSGWLAKVLIRLGYPEALPRSSVEMKEWFLARSDSSFSLGDPNKTKAFYRPNSLQDAVK